MRFACRSSRREAPRTFSPPSLGSCVLWLRSDLGITLSSSNVSAWADQSGNGNNVSQGTAGLQPSYTSANSSYGNEPTLNFVAGSTSSMAQASGTLGIAAQPFTIFVVGDPEGSGGTIVSDATSLTGLYAASTDLGIYAGAAKTSTLAISGASVLVGTFNGASSQVFVNGTSQTPASSPGTGAMNSGVFTIGNASLDGAISAHIAEIVVYSRLLSATEISMVGRYMGARYAINTTF